MFIATSPSFGEFYKEKDKQRIKSELLTKENKLKVLEKLNMVNDFEHADFYLTYDSNSYMFQSHSGFKVTIKVVDLSQEMSIDKV